MDNKRSMRLAWIQLGLVGVCLLEQLWSVLR